MATSETLRAMWLLLGGAVVVAACSAADGSALDDGAGAGSSSGQGASAGTDVTLTTGGSGGGTNPDGCSEAAKLVYVVGSSNELLSFAPATSTFSPVGTINCPAAGATPFSMAVDRSGMAWVLFSDGRLYNVDTATAGCTPTGFVPNQALGFELFGMGFVADDPGSTAETLFVGAYGGQGIGRIDLSNLALTVVGNYDGIFGAAEITGTGDARLYGFFSTANDTVAQIDKNTAHILDVHYPSVDIGDAWAFAFWGGSFYLFTNPQMFGSSQVDRYDPQTQTTTTVVPSVGIRIVGAGVSTCAPVAPPS